MKAEKAGGMKVGVDPGCWRPEAKSGASASLSSAQFSLKHHKFAGF